MPDQYLNDKWKQGQLFEQFVYHILDIKGGCHLVPYVTKEEQKLGENQFGMEIKFQFMQMQTGRLWFETVERRAVDGVGQGPWHPSGIWRHDNSWLMATGYWHMIYIFAIRDLRRYQLCRGPELRTNRRQTSIGWLMEAATARKVALRLYNTERYYEGIWRPSMG